MTALATANRADLKADLEALQMLSDDISRRLAFAHYPDTSQLCADRARLSQASKQAGEVMGSLALLGTDPEARD